jgi:hypothetical protein
MHGKTTLKKMEKMSVLGWTYTYRLVYNFSIVYENTVVEYRYLL